MYYKFFRQETGETEDVLIEKWRWEAYYSDGTFLKQFDDEGKFHQFKEIDQTRLVSFKMVSDTNQNGFTLGFNPAMKLIHFYRNIVFNAGTPDENRMKIYCFGYEMKIEGKTYKTLFCIMPDDGVVITDDIEKLSVK